MPLFSHRLEPYIGNYSVGTHDLEVQLPKPEIFGTADLLRTLKPALIMETILCTLYYPAKEPTSSSSRQHMNWLERPLNMSISGYSRFLNKSKYIIGPALYILASGTQVPAFIDAELADKKSDGKDELCKNLGEVEGRKDVVGSSVSSSTSELGTLVDEDGSNQFPLIVFSHGLGGNRTTYTQYCGELASRGYIVAVLEHRDGTGPITVVKRSDGTTRIIDYIKPDTDLFYKPPSPILSSIDFRKEQLTMRTAEITAVLDVLKRIQSGDGGKVEDENMRRVQGAKFDLGSWKGRIDMVKEVAMAGHSFGGATTLQVLRAGKTYPFVRGITLDPWIDPIPPLPSTSSSSSTTSSAKPAATSSDKLGTDIEVPLLIFNSEAFTLWSTHYGEVRRIAEGVKQDAKSWLMTLVGSIHLSFSDFPLIQPFIASRAGARVESKLAMSLFVEASHEFLTGDNNGTILGEKVIPGDEKGTREGEGYKQSGGKPMEKVGEVRMHLRPE